MSQLPTIGYSQVYTHKKVLKQDIPNSFTDFTAVAFFQDFTILGIPANHMILGVKMSILVNFDPGASNTATMYVGEASNFPAVPTPYVTDISKCYGVVDLVIPSGSDDSYEYGSFRWFRLSTPGSNSTISPAYCLPQRTDAHDVIARVVISGGHNVSQMLAGAIEITTQYGPF